MRTSCRSLSCFPHTFLSGSDSFFPIWQRESSPHHQNRLSDLCMYWTIQCSHGYSLKVESGSGNNPGLKMDL